MQKLKAKVFEILDKTEQQGIADKIFDVIIISMIILNAIAVVIEPSVKNTTYRGYLNIFEKISIVTFTVEYLMRIWVADLWYANKGPIISRLIFIVSPMPLVDLAAILPFYIPFLIPVDLRVLRLLRLFRLFGVLKINRYNNALGTLLKVIKAKADQLISVMFVIIIMIIMSSVLMYNIESAAQPEVFNSVFASMWWAVSTITTVGYGDIYPITLIGKILAASIAMLGIGIVAIPTGIIASGYTELVQKKDDKPKSFCPYCGNEIEKY